MKANREEFSEDNINLLRHSVEDYSPFVLRAVEKEDEYGTMDKCHGERYTRAIVFIVLAPATGRLVHDVSSESVAVTISVITFGYMRGVAWDCELHSSHEALIPVSERKRMPDGEK